MVNQINILKGIAIIGVIFVHTVPSDLVTKWKIAFTLNQQVSIFIILSGITGMISCKKRKLFRLRASLRQEYIEYISRRFKSILPMIGIVFVISGLLYILLDVILGLRNGYGVGIYSIIGRLPLDGPGCYYIAILFQIILMTPILVYGFNKNPKITLIIMIILNLVFEIIIANTQLFIQHDYIYKVCLLRYFGALGLGMWISNDINIKSKRNLFIIILAPISLVYIYYCITYGYTFPGVSKLSWHFQNIFSIFYSTTLVLIVINYFKNSDSRISNMLQRLGKISFSIFLFQILYFSIGLSIIDSILIKILNINNHVIVYGIAVLIDISLCYIGAIYLNKLESVVINLCKKIRMKNV